MLAGRPPVFVGGPPTRSFGRQEMLWGNTAAVDVANFRANELQPGGDMERDLSMCCPASEDLRNVILSVGALPEEFRGRLQVHINDVNHRVVARHFAILSTLFTGGENAVDVALALWFSTRMTAPQCEFLRAVLRQAVTTVNVAEVQFRGASPRSRVSDAISCIRLIDEGDGRVLKTVSISLDPGMQEHLRDDKAPEERERVMLSRADHIDRILHHFDAHQRVAVKHFRETGVFLPFGADEEQHDILNGLLFDPKFGWSMNDSSDPMEGFAVPDVIASGHRHGVPANDLYGHLYFHVRDLLLTFVAKCRHHTVHITLTAADASDLASFAARQRIVYDRVYVSNLVDDNYLGTERVLLEWMPLLRPTNPASSLVALFQNWAALSGNQLQDKHQELQAAIGIRMEERKHKFEAVRKNKKGKGSTLAAIAAEATAGALGVGIDRLYDNSSCFTTWSCSARVRATEQRVAAWRRPRNQVVPMRFFVPVGAAADSMPKVDVPVRDVTDAWNQYQERFVEWQRLDKQAGALTVHGLKSHSTVVGTTWDTLRAEANQAFARGDRQVSLQQYEAALAALQDSNASGSLSSASEDYVEAAAKLLSNISHTQLGLKMAKQALQSACSSLQHHVSWYRGWQRKAMALHSLGRVVEAAAAGAVARYLCVEMKDSDFPFCTRFTHVTTSSGLQMQLTATELTHGAVIILEPGEYELFDVQITSPKSVIAWKGGAILKRRKPRLGLSDDGMKTGKNIPPLSQKDFAELKDAGMVPLGIRTPQELHDFLAAYGGKPSKAMDEGFDQSDVDRLLREGHIDKNVRSVSDLREWLSHVCVGDRRESQELALKRIARCGSESDGNMNTLTIAVGTEQVSLLSMMGLDGGQTDRHKDLRAPSEAATKGCYFANIRVEATGGHALWIMSGVTMLDTCHLVSMESSQMPVVFATDDVVFLRCKLHGKVGQNQGAVLVTSTDVYETIKAGDKSKQRTSPPHAMLAECNIAHFSGPGVEIRKGGSASLEDVVMSDVGQGVTAHGEPGPLVMRRTEIARSEAEGIALGSGARAEISECRIMHSGSFGISVDDGGWANIQRSTISDSLFWGIIVKSQSNLCIEDSCVRDNKCGGLYIGNNYNGDVLVRGCKFLCNRGKAMFDIYNESSEKVKRELKEASKLLIRERMLCGNRRVFTKPPRFEDCEYEDNEELQIAPKENACFCCRSKVGDQRTLSSTIGALHADDEGVGETGSRPVVDKLSSCQQCRIARYCSKECQLAHWPRHKHDCKIWRDLYDGSVVVPLDKTTAIGDQQCQIMCPHPGVKVPKSFKKRSTGEAADVSLPEAGMRFVVKIQTQEMDHSAMQRLTIYNESRAVSLSSVVDPAIYYHVLEHGVLGASGFTSKKIYVYAEIERSDAGVPSLRLRLKKLAPRPAW